MKQTAQMRAIATKLEVTPFRGDDGKRNVELTLTAVGGVSKKMADWLTELIYNNEPDGPGGNPKVLEVVLQFRSNEGVVAGPAKAVSVTVRTKGGEA